MVRIFPNVTHTLTPFFEPVQLSENIPLQQGNAPLYTVNYTMHCLLSEVKCIGII
jgi:hypothetical protein